MITFQQGKPGVTKPFVVTGYAEDGLLTVRVRREVSSVDAEVAVGSVMWDLESEGLSRAVLVAHEQ